MRLSQLRRNRANLYPVRTKWYCRDWQKWMDGPLGCRHRSCVQHDWYPDDPAWRDIDSGADLSLAIWGLRVGPSLWHGGLGVYVYADEFPVSGAPPNLLAVRAERVRRAEIIRRSLETG